MGRIAALGGEDGGGVLDGLDVLGEGRGHHEDEALVLALLLGVAVGLEEGLGAEVDAADGRARGAGDAAGDARQLLHRSEVDDVVEDLVEAPGGDAVDDVLLVDHLARAEVEGEAEVGLGALGDHLTLLDEPELLVLDREADLA